MSKIQLRRGTAAEWTSADPTLSSGEIGFETDTNKIKIGDGSTAWTSLAYFASDSVLNKYDATTAPTTGDDDGDGYSVGSVWIDVTGDTPYICVDASTGAAVWIDISGGSDIAPIPTAYADLAALVAAQGAQTTNYIYEVTDGSGFTGVDSGIVWVKYKGTTTGDETDYTWQPRPSSGSGLPVPYGYLYNKNTWTDATDFTTYGNATAVLSGDKINIGTTTNGSYNNYIAIGNPTGLGKWRMTMEVEVINAPTSTTYGLGLGIRSRVAITANAFQTLSRLSMATGAQGYLYIDYGGTSYINYVTNTSAFAISQNDVIRFTLEQDLDVITMTVLNLTTGVSKSASYTYTVPSAPFPSNTGNFVIHNFGGTYELQSLKIESKEWKNAKLMCVGDSKTNGFNGDDFSSSFTQQLEFFYRGVHDSSGGNDTTDEVLLKIPEIIAFTPQKVLLNIGSNDKRYGATFTEWKTNYHDIVSQLETAGIDVYHLLQLNEDSLTFTDYNDEIIAEYDADRIVDAGVIPLDAGGIHPNQEGMDQIFYAILSQIGGSIN